MIFLYMLHDLFNGGTFFTASHGNLMMNLHFLMVLLISITNERAFKKFENVI